MFGIGQYFPPPAHAKRVRRYRENKKLFVGEHYDVFERVQNRLSKSQREIAYISVNMAGLIVKKGSDFLFGESPTYSAGKDDNAPEQKALERLVTQNNFRTLTYESSLGNGYRGDSFIKIRWGQKYGGKLDKSIDPFRIFIEPQNAEYVYPEADPFNAKNIVAYHIAYPVLYEDGEILNQHDLTNLAGEPSGGVMPANGTGDQWTLNVESHYPGKIVYRTYRMDPLTVTVDNQITEWKIYAEITSAYNVVETGVPIPLVVHVPNYATDDTWEGIDDLHELKPMLDELNNRISEIAQILTKHSDPAMVVPAGSLEDGDDGRPVFHAGRDKVFEVMDKNEITPGYVTWDGQLQAAFEQLKFLVDQILTVAEIPAVALGKDNSGTSGASGLSIKFRMNSLLAKINRKRQYYDRALKDVLVIAQMLEKSRLGNIGYKITEPIIKFRDGLPDDELEQAQIMALRLGGKATISQKSAIMHLDNYTEEQADAELKRISDEEAAAATVDGSVFNEPSNKQTEEEAAK